jgi:hypothetical protein
MARPRTPAGKAKHLEEILKQIERHQREAERKKLAFTAPTEDQLKKKLGQARSPMIIYQSWNGGAAAGGTINYEVGIYNPDPTPWIWLFVHLFVGPGNMVADIGEALAPVDQRFPRLTQPRFDGLTINSGATEHLNFSFTIPAGMQKSNYMGNSFLFQSVWHDIGEYIDRGVFVFEVT